MIISIICEPSTVFSKHGHRSEELCCNIHTKLKTMYGIIREENPFDRIDNSNKYLCIMGTSNSLHNQSLIGRFNYHNQIFKYFSSRCTHVKSHFTFIIGHRSTAAIKRIYTEFIDNKMYTFCRTCLNFKEHETIVVDIRGKMWYYDVESIMDLITMHKENYFCETMITKLISKILCNESVYHLPHGSFHQDLLRCSDTVTKCRRFMTCESNLPREIRRIIVTLVVTDAHNYGQKHY